MVVFFQLFVADSANLVQAARGFDDFRPQAEPCRAVLFGS